MIATDATEFPIVGVGASAGGVEALEGFFSGIQNRPGLSFVIVTHSVPNGRACCIRSLLATPTSP
jgi:two-component system, chemotaxis family, CheB/CheR fusion protein